MWISLFFLPFQLVDLFGWYTIPKVVIATFIYLGMIAAGEEIEQRFGTHLPEAEQYGECVWLGLGWLRRVGGDGLGDRCMRAGRGLEPPLLGCSSLPDYPYKVSYSRRGSPHICY